MNRNNRVRFGTKRLLWQVGVVGVLLLGGWLPALAVDQLSLFVGQVKIMHTGPVARVAVGNGKLLSTTILENGQLIVLAEAEGITDLHIWRSGGREDHYKVTIAKEDTRGQTSQVRQLLESVPGLAVRQVGDFTVVEGEVDARFRPVVEAVTKKYDSVLDLTRQAAVSANAPMIYMDVKITEFNTSQLDKLGIEWDASINGPSVGYMNQAYRRNGEFNQLQTTADSNLSGLADDLGTVARPLGYFGIASYITSRINFLVSSGDALILAQPRLSARSGGKADFLAGGEVPIPITGADGQLNVEYKKYGISLTIAPVTDASGNIQANVATEVSAIDSSTTVQGLPGFLSRKTTADVAMRNGETLVISGLVNREMAEDVRKLPVLGDIPILGALFRSTSFRNKRTELVIFVTPTIYDAPSPTNQNAVAKSKALIEEFMENTGRELILD